MRDEPRADLDSIVAEAGARLKWSALLIGVCWWLAVCLGLWLALFVFDGMLGLPGGLRFPLALGGAVFTGIHFYRRVLVPAWRRQTPERTALMLERRYGIGENLLINAVQFQRQDLNTEEIAFARRTIDRSTERAGHIEFRELWDWSKLRGWGSAAGAVLLLWGAFILFFPRQFTAAGARYLLPLADVPPPGNLVLHLTPGNDVVVTEGDSLDVALEIPAGDSRSLASPPQIVWQEKTAFIQPVRGQGESIAMDATAAAADAATTTPRKFQHAFANIQAPFAFRVFAGDGYTRSVKVEVRSLPRLKGAVCRITPPAYTGLKPQTIPGPPAPIPVLPGSLMALSFLVEPAVQEAEWGQGDNHLVLKTAGGRWSAQFILTNAGTYEIRGRAERTAPLVPLVRGEVQLLRDNPPEVDFVTQDRNRVVQFGQTIPLDVASRDDFGLAEVSIIARPVDQAEGGTLLKRWSYMGPPGNPGPVRETFSLPIDPRAFSAGTSYYLEAMANDFRPGGTPSRSRPIVLRVKSEQDIALHDDDPLNGAFEALKRAAASQEKANHLTGNLKTYLEEITKKSGLRKQVLALTVQQHEAERHGRESRDQFKQKPEGSPFVQPLTAVVEKDMTAVLSDLKSLESTSRSEVSKSVDQVEARQGRILTDLLSLLGRVAEARAEKLKPAADGKEVAQPPAVAQEERAKETRDEVKNFIADEERILEKSRTLADKSPEDLTQADQANLGELARAEQKWAKFFEEKLTDFSKLAHQDFADSSLSEEINQVFQEIQKAADAMTQKKIELAVPHEQSGLENAKELVNNLERWLPDAPDNIKWNMEEPLNPTDVAMADLPKELEDIVGELLDKEETMTPDVEDVTSSWMDSADKGAGWGAGDGPISDMSAKGVTGNQLPNQNEVGGRSGEGRTGRSHGQMVSDTAEGKGGRETPTRLTPEPFEQGSVKDSAKDDKGGATGGGKLSGFTSEGLRGPAAPPSSDKLPRLADQQARIRQQAEALALKLRRYHLPGGDLETSIASMSKLEQAARKNDGLGVRRAFNQSVDSLGRAKTTVQHEATVKREQNKLPGWMRDEIRVGAQDGVPKGYEEMVGDYFKALAEGKTK